MAVLVTAEVPGQTQQGYDDMLGGLAALIRQAPGFVAHMAHPVEGQLASARDLGFESPVRCFLCEGGRPASAPGMHPKRTYQELHSLLGAVGREA